MRVGVVGAGIMGGGMARRLLSCGHAVTVFDLRPSSLDPLAAIGAATADSAAEAAAGNEFVITSLPRDADVQAAIGGADGVAVGLGAGALVIETSTVSPQTVVGLADTVRAAGGAIVDAPLVTSQRQDRRPVPDDLGPRPSTGQQAAAAGNLGFFVGGEAADFERAGPLLDVLGLEHHHLGPLGSGLLLKLINNAVVGTEVAFLSELMVVGRRAGLDLEQAVELLQSSSANSAVMRTHIARFTVPDEFPTGQFPIDYMIKDLSLALDAAERMGVSCEVVSTALSRFQRASDAGLGEIYNAAVIRTIEAESAGAPADSARPSSE
jgi:3-hydroxyisobutyrate dehydrogenase